MQQLEVEGIEKDITKQWSKLGPEGQGEEVKLAAQHCLLGVQETLSHPNDYTWLEKFSTAYAKHPNYKEFLTFKQEIETGNYQIHFSLDKVRNSNKSRAVYLVTTVERFDHKKIAPATKAMIETWASKIGCDILENDIDRLLKLLCD